MQRSPPNGVRREAARDAPSPTAVADLLLVVSLLGTLFGLAWGVIWVQGAATTTGDVSLWLGATPPLLSALAGGGLLGVRVAYPELPRLRGFLTRMGGLGLAGAAVLAACVAWI